MSWHIHRYSYGLITAEELSFVRTGIPVVTLSHYVHLCNKIKEYPLSPAYLMTCDGSTVLFITI